MIFAINRGTIYFCVICYPQAETVAWRAIEKKLHLKFNEKRTTLSNIRTSLDKQNLRLAVLKKY